MNNTRDESFEISHVFKADPESIYQMWIEPGKFSSWLGPAGADMSFTSIGVKEGGASQWSMTTSDGQTKFGRLNYKIINPNHMLVYVQYFCDEEGEFIKAPFSETYPDYLLTIVRFIKEGTAKTRLTVKWEIFGKANSIERKTFLEMKPLMKTGWTESFKKLELLLK